MSISRHSNISIMKYKVCEIQAWRSMRRHPKTKESLFYTKWEGGGLTLEPMSNFYECDEYNEYMDRIVCDFITTAAKSPFVKRRCLTCNTRVYDGNVFCERRKGVGKCSDLRKKYHLKNKNSKKK